MVLFDFCTTGDRTYIYKNYRQVLPMIMSAYRVSRLRIWFLSGEKKITVCIIPVSGSFNRHNLRILGSELPHEINGNDCYCGRIRYILYSTLKKTKKALKFCPVKTPNLIKNLEPNLPLGMIVCNKYVVAFIAD